MPTQVVHTRARTYTIAPDDAPQPAQRLWGVVQAHVVDELTDLPPRVPLRVATDARALTPRTAAGGMAGLVGRPADVFPKLAEQSYTVRFSIHAEGFLPHHEEVTIPATAQFPLRTIDAATDPAPGDGVLTLGSVANIVANDTLLVGGPGRRERVEVQNVNPGPRQVTILPTLSHDHGGGDPVIVEKLVPFDPATSIAQLIVGLHREPIRLSGRTIRRNGGIVTPAAGATVRITGIWRTLVPAAIEPPAEAPDLASLHPPLYAVRTAATGQLRQREMTEVLGEDKRLLERVAAGADQLSLSDRINLSAGDLLLLDSDPAVQEYVPIDTITPVGAPDLPATITLAHPLAFAHRSGGRVRRVNAQPPGANVPFSDDAMAGDTCVFLNTVAGLTGVNVVEVHGGAAAEFHRLRLFRVVSDGAGRFQLPPLSRVAKLEVQATEGGDSSGAVPFIPRYPARENYLELELS